MICSLPLNAGALKNREYKYDTATEFSGGSGSADDPYLISTWGEMSLVNEYGCGEDGKNVHFKVTADLTEHETVISEEENTFTEIISEPIGSEDKPFEGIFDGDNHIVYSGIYNGNTFLTHTLFGVIGESGEVRNLSYCHVAGVNRGLIENCITNSDTLSHVGHVGGIADENSGTIRCCKTTFTGAYQRASYIYGEVYGREHGIGGICGLNDGGLIEECYSSTSVFGLDENNVAVGGIVGDNTDGIVRNCASEARISNYGKETGGIAGRLDGGTLENCYAVPSIGITSYRYTGGLVGAVYNDYKIISCYSAESRKYPVIGNAKIEEAEYGYTTEQLKQKSLYENWDFKNVWAFNSFDYPAVRGLFTFPDTLTHWGRESVQFAAERGYVSGYEDGTFRPDGLVTKAEFIHMALGDPECNQHMLYTDIPEWADACVRKAYSMGLLEHIDNSETELGANEPITRIEAANIAGKISVYTQNISFTDLDEVPDWAIAGLKSSVNHKFMKGYEDGTFRPNNTLTRAEAAAIVSKGVRETFEFYLNTEQW